MLLFPIKSKLKVYSFRYVAAMKYWTHYQAWIAKALKPIFEHSDRKMEAKRPILTTMPEEDRGRDALVPSLDPVCFFLEPRT